MCATMYDSNEQDDVHSACVQHSGGLASCFPYLIGYTPPSECFQMILSTPNSSNFETVARQHLAIHSHKLLEVVYRGIGYLNSADIYMWLDTALLKRNSKQVKPITGKVYQHSEAVL